jgi:hypothetical protein
VIVAFATALALATLLAYDLHQTIEDQPSLLLVGRRRPIGEIILSALLHLGLSIGHGERASATGAMF